MTLGLIDIARNAALNPIRDLIDAGTGPGSLTLYDGVRPAKGGPITNKVSEHTLSDPCASDAVNGVLTFNGISNGVGLRDALATWARVADSDGNFIMDVSVGNNASDAECKIEDPNIVTDTVVKANSMTITAGGA